MNTDTKVMPTDKVIHPIITPMRPPADIDTLFPS